MDDRHSGGSGLKPLARLKRATFPRTLLFWDAETYVYKDKPEEPHRFRLAWICVRRERQGREPTYDWTLVRKPEDFWRIFDAVASTDRETWCIAHNLGYDFMVCGGFTSIFRLKWKPTMFYFAKPVTLMKFKRGQSKVWFVDCGNFFPGKLEKWGAEIGLPKLEVDVFDMTDAEAVPYCRRDVEIMVSLFNSLFGLIREHKLGGLGLTVPSQAMKAYRSRFMRVPIVLHKIDDLHAFERQGYYGGRCDCFHVGPLPPGKYTVLDVNSMYPYVMRNHKYPCRFYRSGSLETVKQLQEDIKQYAVMARVHITIEKPLVPRLDGGKLTFPVGSFWTVLATPELEAVLEHGVINRVAKVALYFQAPIFKEYVDTLYRLRQKFKADGQTLWSNMVKLLLNSLYGKWGQRATDWTFEPNDGQYPPGPLLSHVRGQHQLLEGLCLGEWVWRCVGKHESHISFPAIAAHVTSFARMELQRYIEIAGLEHVYYVDTDSLTVDATGLKRLWPMIDPVRLGCLKQEYDFTKGCIYTLKDYAFGDTVKHKGLSKAAELLPDGSYKDIQWPSLQGMLHQGRLSGYANRIVHKRLIRVYDKGRVSVSGRVLPFVLDEPSRTLPTIALPF